MTEKNKNEDVKLYTIQGCPACAKAKQYLDGKKTKYDEIDVNDDLDKVMEITGGGNSVKVPILCSKNKCEIGFEPETFDRILKKKRK